MLPDLSTLTVSAETGRALRDAGFPQDTALTWQWVPAPDGTSDDPLDGEFVVLPASHAPALCAAPTLAEILAAMPKRLYLTAHECLVEFVLTVGHTLDNVPCVGYEWRHAHQYASAYRAFDPNPAEAAAQCFLSAHAAGKIPNGEADRG